MKKYYPLFVFFICSILVLGCQNDTDTSTTTKTEASETTKTYSKGSIPDSTAIDSNWVPTLQGNWILDTDPKLSIQIAGNTYIDLSNGAAKGTFQVEYSDGCKKCKTEQSLGKNKCLVIFNDDKINESTCLLLSKLNARQLEIINTKHPDIVYTYTRK